MSKALYKDAAMKPWTLLKSVNSFLIHNILAVIMIALFTYAKTLIVYISFEVAGLLLPSY